MTKTFEWNGLVVQVLEDSIEIKPKTPADLYTDLPVDARLRHYEAVIPATTQHTNSSPNPCSEILGPIINRYLTGIAKNRLEVECEEIKSEPIDSKMTSLQITVLKKR